ncbi:M23 family metallopeptidase [Streptomyces sp. XM4193]|uniref:M23 family metallopeptidase n=1 Tax=Streptomyces sp. XM4193 TaxID=2929782 RepID=UPI001FF84FD7|nr:M23 family metallopeptidase [Streptomyces sp. XM4193]MCK1794481.1 M23 family metallopeptidase [Streptomyces sp. XM4193]
MKKRTGIVPAMILMAGLAAPSASAAGTHDATATDQRAQATNFQLPFTCGDPWRLDTWGHNPALDMVAEPDQHGTEGAPLLASEAGTVNLSFWHDNAGNVVQIDHGGGYFTTYIHLESRSVEVGDTVAQGAGIGFVGRTGAGANDHPHLHFELGIDADGDGQASWGAADSERVNAVFDGVEYAGAAQTWRDVVSNNC